MVLKTTKNNPIDIIIHKWLKVPYALHTTEFQTPKRPIATVVLIHGIGNSAKVWEDVVALLPNNIRIIGVDLLGFGSSPSPAWATYSAKAQARSLGYTLLNMRFLQQPILVGHSLGSIVAVAAAKRYPLLVKQLILCSPPFYAPPVSEKRRLQRDEMLREIYRVAKKRPELLQKFTPMLVKLGLVAKTINITSDNIEAYTAALEASIINQTSLEDAAKLRMPIRILYGSLDPVVIGKHIKTLTQTRNNITARQLLVGHEIMGRYTKVLADEIATRV